MRTPLSKDTRYADKLRAQGVQLRYVMTVDLNDPESARKLAELMRPNKTLIQSHSTFGLRDTRGGLVVDGFIIVKE